MKTRIVALIAALFGGGFGIHKFYLRQTTAGIIYLVFCWTGIPTIFAFFDFLVLLFMSDRTFDHRFNSASGGHKYVNNVNYARQQSSKEIAQTLGEVKNLYDKGIITAEEYEAKRRKLLDLI